MDVRGLDRIDVRADGTAEVAPASPATGWSAPGSPSRTGWAAPARGLATAFPHRSALTSIQVEVSLRAGEANARRAMGVARDELGKMFGANGYVSSLDPQTPDWAQACYGASLTRLREVARKYDPDSVFTFAQGLA